MSSNEEMVMVQKIMEEPSEVSPIPVPQQIIPTDILVPGPSSQSHNNQENNTSPALPVNPTQKKNYRYALNN